MFLWTRKMQFSYRCRKNSAQSPKVFAQIPKIVQIQNFLWKIVFPQNVPLDM